MSDLRDKKTNREVFDLTSKTRGNHTFKVDLWCPVYSGMKNEDVYVKHPSFLLKAMDFDSASEKAQIIAASIREVHDIWQVEVYGVAKA